MPGQFSRLMGARLRRPSRAISCGLPVQAHRDRQGPQTRNGLARYGAIDVSIHSGLASVLLTRVDRTSSGAFQSLGVPCLDRVSKGAPEHLARFPGAHSFSWRAVYAPRRRRSRTRALSRHQLCHSKKRRTDRAIGPRSHCRVVPLSTVFRSRGLAARAANCARGGTPRTWPIGI